MKYAVRYRGTEIEAEVDASTSEEAMEKFLAGDVASVHVHFDSLHPDMVEAELVDDTFDAGIPELEEGTTWPGPLNQHEMGRWYGATK